MHPKLAFVVVRTSAPDTSLFDDRFERFGPPFVARVDGHHVIVPIDQYGFSFRVDDFFSIDHRIAIGRHHIGPVGSGFAQGCGQPFGAMLHIRFVFGLRTDGWDAQ